MEETNNGVKEKEKILTPEKVIQASDVEDTQDLVAWVTSLAGGHAPFTVTVERRAPKQYKGVKTDGVVGSFDHPITEEEIRDQFGGGSYLIRVRSTVEGRSRWIGKARTLDIAGPPILPRVDDDDDEPKVRREDNTATATALSMAERLTKEYAQRSSKAEEDARRFFEESRRAPAIDTGLIEALVTPLREQNALLQSQLADMQKQMLAPKSNPVTDQLLLRAVEGESARIQAIQVQHESELRQLRSQAQDDVKRAEDRHTRLMEIQERAHEREVAALREQINSIRDSLRISYEAQIKTLDGQIASLRDELSAARGELGEMRAKKDKPITEQIAELAQLKDLMGAFGGNNGEEAETPVWQKVMEAINTNPLVAGIAERIAASAQGAAPGVQQAQMAPQQVVNAMPANGGSALSSLPRPTPAVKKPKLPHGVTRQDLAKAVGFLETAFNNGANPDSVGMAARSSLSGNLIDAALQAGPDKFLELGGAPPQSPLFSFGGKQFLKKVFEAARLPGTPAQVHRLVEPEVPAVEAPAPDENGQ